MRIWRSTILHVLCGLILDFPDGPDEKRWPQVYDQCRSQSSLTCRQNLRNIIVRDLNCSKIHPYPREYPLLENDAIIVSNACDAFVRLFKGVYDAVKENDLSVAWTIFKSVFEAIERVNDSYLPYYANTTKEVARRHFEKVISLTHTPQYSNATAVATMAGYFFENMSVATLLNYLLNDLEFNEATPQKLEDYYAINKTRYVFHDIGPKRWEVLFHLLEKVNARTEPSFMAEIGVDKANSTLRVLDSFPLLSWVGVDPYLNREDYNTGDKDYEWVDGKLKNRTNARLIRTTSVNASAFFPPRTFDLVFLDARHDFSSVEEDIVHWINLVRRGGILCGHDFQWQYPGLTMAVSSISVKVNKEIHLATDGMWWFEM